ncbi:aspartate carbamoyltransferase [Candidatus Peregrinibacteria bacterium CG_4_10_14_0_2_um_filter_43_11]|nr:MAG: aspartate carbamoyltransferase [Candidatus Peregrinibacteria bacterium CG_4_10_14_0_2_um_filter_43_11]
MKRTQLITTVDITREEVDFFIDEAEALRNKRTQDLDGKIIATLFLEPSTRTRLSFESAILRLGGQFINVADPKTCSIKKGETLEDTIRMVEKYADAIVMRHSEAGAAKLATQVTKKPFINAGDGANQHPTQAMLDMLTIHREFGTVDGLTIGFVGDLKFSRTVHSLLYILAHYNVKVLFISPDVLKIPESYTELLKEHGIDYEENIDLEKYLPAMDVLYMTRIQQERFDNPSDYEALKGCYVLTVAMVKKGKTSLRVLHPLPRVDEIATDVDALPQAAYFRQAENGVYMRMALLKNFCI